MNNQLFFQTQPQIQSKPTNILESFTQLQALTDLSFLTASISVDNLREITRDLTELIFFSTSSNRFFSFTQTEDEISLLIDESTLSNFGGKDKLEVVLDQLWIPIKRVKKHGFREVGVVSALATLLRDISILYLSTFASAILMVRKEDYLLAVERLETDGFLVNSSNYSKKLSNSYTKLDSK